MSKIVFFNIPAHGHTNPTLAVVEELVQRGHEVWYYSFAEFKEKIQETGAKFIPCDEFLPEFTPEVEKKVGKDFAALMEMGADTTVKMDEKVCRELQEFQPDCIVGDSVCIWGKLFPIKLGIPFICSTTTFAMNQSTSKLMKPSFKELLRMILGIPRINKKMKMLRAKGYEVKSYIDLIGNDNETDTIVFTSKEFQPMAETFSAKYAFVGPSLKMPEVEDGKEVAKAGEVDEVVKAEVVEEAEEVTKTKEVVKGEKKPPLIYISLGTVLNQNRTFYKNCIEGLKDLDCQVIMSVGEKTDLASFGDLPEKIKVYPRVDQLKVLQQADVFITHCGMNSVSESLYFGVPTVLFPQHSEQMMVANRTAS